MKTDADLNEKEGSHKNSHKEENKKTYFTNKQFLKTEAITKEKHVEESDTLIKSPNKSDLARSTVKRTGEQTTITRSHFQSGASKSATKGQGTMGSLMCVSSGHDEKADKLQQKTKKRKQGTSDDSNKAKRPSQYTERHRSSANGKTYTQPTLHHYESRTRAPQKAQQEKIEHARFHKHSVDRDTGSYRKGYPGKEDNPHLNDNLRFYRGEIMSAPRGAYIDEIHKKWWGDYALLEKHHGYIQWLFPIRESGMNSRAQPLQLHEAKAIKADLETKNRVLMSYKLMLDFYGMELEDIRTGTLKRSKNWRRCYDNLNRSSHNYLRITRILKCLGELGYEHLKKGFLKFVLEEALVYHTLGPTLTSCRDYWIGTIKDDQDREELYRFIEEHHGGSNR